MRFALVALLVAVPVLAQPLANNCADPYWKPSLRCNAFPNQVPQPNLNDAPTKIADLRQHTRVWLDDDPTLRCVDGTMPLIYVDKAVCTNPQGCGTGVRYGDPIDSNKWIFGFHGGDACEGERCLTFYQTLEERPNMSTWDNDAMRNIDGIYDGDPARNPIFASYNRVKVEKCTFDRYLGRTEQTITPTVLGVPYNVTLFHHGYRIIQAMFAALEKGMAYKTWQNSAAVVRRRSCCGGESAGKVMPVYEKLPPLANAEVVVLIGHSNASHGLYHNADNLSAMLNAISGFHGDVRAVFDENFMPIPEGEAAFSSTAPANSDAYDGINTGTSSARGETFTYDLADHFQTQNVVVEYGVHGALLDTSCAEVHKNDKPWKCNDRHHVLFNHVSTPFLLKEDFTDPNRDHNDSPIGNEARWAVERNFTYCPDANPCSPRFTQAEFRTRVEKQMRTLLEFAQTRSELSKGIDKSLGGAAKFPTFFVWGANCGVHDGAFEPSVFTRALVTNSSSSTLAQYIDEFLHAGRLGTRNWRIDGLPDPTGRMVTSQCR